LSTRYEQFSGVPFSYERGIEVNDVVTSEAVGRTEINDLVSELERSGIVAITLGELRQSIAHVDRLGRYVLAMIEQTLSEHGIGYFPETAFSHPAPRQHHEVRLYLRDSEIGRAVEAVLHPSPAGDAFLRGLSALAPEGAAASDARDS
jgi:hypothetical protein